LGQLISAIQPIFFVPLFLSAWGSEGYGQWCIFFAVVSYFSLLDFGCQSHIGNILTEEFIKKYKKNFQANLSNSVSFFVFISGAIFVILMGILTILIIFSPDYFSKKNLLEPLLF
jgi:O-antigen/teichoic acid export membrane protein